MGPDSIGCAGWFGADEIFPRFMGNNMGLIFFGAFKNLFIVRVNNIGVYLVRFILGALRCVYFFGPLTSSFIVGR